MSAAPTPLVYVLDDEEDFRKSLQWMLKAAKFRVATFATGEYFLATYEPGAAACLVLDMRMPGMNGLEVQEELIRRGDRIPIVFVTAHGDIAMAVRALKRGAFDFIEKPANGKTLLALIRSACRQDSRKLAMEARAAELRERVAALSQREHEVMQLVLEGKTNKAMAGELGIGVKTIESHRARMMEKLGADSIAELVRIVISASPNLTRS